MVRELQFEDKKTSAICQCRSGLPDRKWSLADFLSSKGLSPR